MTPNTVQTAIAGAQLAATPRDRASPGDAAETASFAATLDSALASSAGPEPADAGQAPGARGAARAAPAKDERHDKAEGTLLAALLAFGALPLATPADATPPATQRAAGVRNAAAPGAALPDGMSTAAAPAPLTVTVGPAVDATQLREPQLQAGQPGAELRQAGRAVDATQLREPPLQAGQPGADLLQAGRAVAAALQATPAQVEARPAAGAPETPGLDAATVGNRPAGEPAALRLTDGSPRAPQVGAQAAQPLPPVAANPVAGATAGNMAGSPRREDAPEAAPAAPRTADAAAPGAPAPVQVALSRPLASRRDERANEHADESMPPAPATGSTPAAAGGELRPGAAVAQLAPPVGSEQWGPALSQQVVRLGSGREVELNLNPAELGPLKVKLSLAEGQAQVMFVSDHLAVRQAIEAAIPQLRSSFADNGISLGQATVGSGSGDAPAQQRQNQPAPEQPRTLQPDTPAGEAVRSPVAARAGGPASALDTFA